MHLHWTIRQVFVIGAATALIVCTTEPPASSPIADPVATDRADTVDRDGDLDSSVTTGSPVTLSEWIDRTPDGGTLWLTAALQGQGFIDQGPIAIDRHLTIYASASAPAITTAGRHGAFRIEPGGALRLIGVEFRHASGAAQPVIENRGQLLLEDVVIRDNFNVLGPAALRSEGTVFAHRLTVQNNRSHTGPGAVQIAEGDGYFYQFRALENHGTRGGALANRATLRMRDTYFALNTADEGGAIYNAGGLDLSQSAFWINHGTGLDSFAGALLTEGVLRVTNTTFHGNEATFGSALVADGGRTQLAHTTFYANPNRAGSDVFLGAQALMQARNSVFSGAPDTAISVDIVGHGTLESLGGNIVPNPVHTWPEDQIGADDWIGNPRTDRLSKRGGVGPRGWIGLVPLGQSHPGRKAIPVEYCRDARDRPLERDQAGNLRPKTGHCDAGAHQSTPQTLTDIQITTDESTAR